MFDSHSHPLTLTGPTSARISYMQPSSQRICLPSALVFPPTPCPPWFSRDTRFTLALPVSA
jgi:hypothetical protein